MVHSAMVRRMWWVPALAWGVLAGWWTPRGPLTGGQALWSVGISVAVGLLAGWASRSRWSMLIAPAVFVVALELTRYGATGPSVDGVQVSPFGLIALLTGRGVHGLLSVLPMTLAAAYGTALTRRSPAEARATERRPAGSGRRATEYESRRAESARRATGYESLPAESGRKATKALRYARRAVTAALTAALLVLIVAVAVPARTAPPTGPRGIAELTSVTVGTHRLGMMIRGADTALPVLLFLPGAPGGSEFGAMRRHLAALEQHFVVVTLDRRGAGSSYPALDPTATVTLAGAVADTVAVAEHLRRRFRQERIVLLAHSGGSIVGVLAVRSRPELFRAYVGTGQAVDLPASDRITYADLLAWARATGRDALARGLAAQGPPPYRDVYDYEPLMLHAGEVYGDAGTGGLAEGLAATEYTLLQKAHTMTAVLDTWSVLYPRMQEADLRVDAPSLDVPVYFVQGGREMRGLAELFAQWYALLRAPAKRLIVLDGAGHRAMFDQPARFTEAMKQMLTQTRP